MIVVSLLSMAGEPLVGFPNGPGHTGKINHVVRGLGFEPSHINPTSSGWGWGGAGRGEGGGREIGVVEIEFNHMAKNSNNQKPKETLNAKLG